LDGTRLHFRELIEASDKINKHMYSYHYQEADGALIFRYDDTPHHEGLPGFPHHKHSRNETNVVAADPPELIDVLNEIQSLYPLKRPNTS
jgi:hypothetical protein